MKLAGYKVGVFKRKKLGCYVISLGNITVGGTGKTPTAQRLARDIRDMGYRVVILNRGYRAKWKGEVGIVSDGRTLQMDASQAGDEAFMKSSEKSCKIICTKKINFREDSGVIKEKAIETLQIEADAVRRLVERIDDEFEAAVNCILDCPARVIVTGMIGRVLWQEFFNNRDWPVASAVAIVMLLLLIVPIMWFHKHQQKQMGDHG